MRLIADLHIHSKYARACSKLLTPENLDLWARKKGIGILGTGDFTHPGWMEELEEKLEEVKPGLYQLRLKDSPFLEGLSFRPSTLFMFTGELASIYKQGDKVRRVHNLVFAPSIDAAKKFNGALEKRGANLKSDGRPIMGVHCDELVKIAKDVHPQMEIIPAHAWTPHFGVFGSLSGFDSLEEAFGDQAKHIFAIETGLSSDPRMNWQVEDLIDIGLISNSDPHSLHRLGREANVFNVDSQKLSYLEVIRIIREKNPREFLSTIEFFPEEGRYHLDGHSDCKFSCIPEETERMGGVCPVCGKKLLKGVLNRVSSLGEASYSNDLNSRIPFSNVVSLEEIIAETFGVGVVSKRVQAEYEQLVRAHTEFSLLLDFSQEELFSYVRRELALNIMKTRNGNVNITPGYDGIYGKIHILEAANIKFKRLKNQQTLF